MSRVRRQLAKLFPPRRPRYVANSLHVAYRGKRREGTGPQPCPDGSGPALDVAAAEMQSGAGMQRKLKARWAS